MIGLTRITLTFKKSNGELIETVQANEGDDIVDVSWEYDLDIEGELTVLARSKVLGGNVFSPSAWLSIHGRLQTSAISRG